MGPQRHGRGPASSFPCGLPDRQPGHLPGMEIRHRIPRPPRATTQRRPVGHRSPLAGSCSGRSASGPSDYPLSCPRMWEAPQCADSFLLRNVGGTSGADSFFFLPLPPQPFPIETTSYIIEPILRMAAYPSGLRERSAKPLLVGSNPTDASNLFVNEF